MLERTVIVFKPDAVERGLVGEILSRFEQAGLKILDLKVCIPSQLMLRGGLSGVIFPRRLL